VLQKAAERNEEKTPGQVRALARALSILRELGREPAGLSLTELSNRVNLAPSTTHRLLTTLETQRFARLSAVDSRWRIGVETFSTGAAFVRARDIVEIARPTLMDLRDQTGETANLFVSDLTSVVCMVQVDSPHQMRAMFAIGGRLPVHATAAGKIFLAYMREDSAIRMIRGNRPDRLTERTIIDPEKLIEDVRATKARGVSFDNEEHAIGLRCVAAPVFDEFGNISAAISLSGPSARIDMSRHQEIAGHVQRAAVAITTDFGGIAPKSG
jgi:IclR family acetate operon transcriptional repressor